MFYNPLFAKRIPLPFLLAFAFTVYADQPMPETDLIDEISTLYLQRFPEKVISAEEVTKKTQEKLALQTNITLKPIKIDLPETNYEKVAHEVIKQNIKTSDKTILPFAAFKKLNIAGCKKTTNAEKSEIREGLVDIVCKSTHSLLAKNVTLFELGNPATDIETIKERQKLVKELQKNELKARLNKNQQFEKTILALFDVKQPLLDSFIESTTYYSNSQLGILLNSISFGLLKPVQNFLDKHPLMLETKNPFGPVSFLCATLGNIIACLKPTIFDTENNTDFSSLTLLARLKKTSQVSLVTPLALNLTTVPFVGSFAGYKLHTNQKAKQALGNLISAYPNTAVFFGLEIPFFFYIITCMTYNIEKHWTDIQTKLIGLANYLDQIRSVVKHFKKHNLRFELAFPELKELANLDNKTKHSADFNQLIDLLKTGTFKGNASIVSYLGRVKCAYKLFMNVRAEFEPILYAMGKLQMYQGLADLVSSSDEQENRFCFAEFSHEGPFVDARDCWNMMVGQDKAVSNSILITPDQKDIIIHGPNTGGKTTTLLSFMYALIIAQAFGIAPCSYLKFSLFAQFNCFFDIQDDVAAGTSLFESEVKFATELYERIVSLKEGEYAFTICDEIMRSTSPEEGQKCAYQFTNKMGKHAGSVCFTVTHYPKLLELCNLPGFRTFYVEVVRDARGQIRRTFKFKEGITDLNIAKDILQKHGLFDKDDLHEMHTMSQTAAAA
ncbi:hypothetical protein IPH25_03410 [bacterium]|nr:MAG: hypothetical protein IPG37_00400 [bacterium]QQR61509.1 MAG: hypothetical protein IPH25_03410 [bacterium]